MEKYYILSDIELNYEQDDVFNQYCPRLDQK